MEEKEPIQILEQTPTSLLLASKDAELLQIVIDYAESIGVKVERFTEQ